MSEIIVCHCLGFSSVGRASATRTVRKSPFRNCLTMSCPLKSMHCLRQPSRECKLSSSSSEPRYSHARCRALSQVRGPRRPGLQANDITMSLILSALSYAARKRNCRRQVKIDTQRHELLPCFFAAAALSAVLPSLHIMGPGALLYWKSVQVEQKHIPSPPTRARRPGDRS